MKLKRIILLLFVSVFVQTVFGSDSCSFRTYKKINDTIYAPNVTILNPNDGKFLEPTVLTPTQHINVSPRMDIYIPELVENEAQNTNFPLVIICHGAGATKSAKAYQFLAHDFASRGYVVASIDFRFDDRYKIGFVKLITQKDLLKSLNPISGLAYNTAYADISFYSNAIDVSLAIDFLVGNAINFKIDTTKIVLGGLSMGAGTTLYKLYINKEEISHHFPTTFFTDARYIDTKTNTNKVKCAFAYMGGITNIDAINSDENTPLFLYHGKQESLVPFYKTNLLCDTLQPYTYGSAAIVEKLDSFPDNLGFSYYFIEAKELGHTLHLGTTLDSGINYGFFKLHLPDMFRFIHNSLYNTSYKNQVHKKISPHNDCFSFCNSNFFISQWNDGINFENISNISGRTCSVIPDLNLSTKPWLDIIPPNCNDFYPPILKNCSSDVKCTLQNRDSTIVFPVSITTSYDTIVLADTFYSSAFVFTKDSSFFVDTVNLSIDSTFSADTIVIEFTKQTILYQYNILTTTKVDTIKIIKTKYVVVNMQLNNMSISQDIQTNKNVIHTKYDTIINYDTLVAYSTLIQKDTMVTNVPDTKLKTIVLLYPNPAKNQLNIELPYNNPINKIEVLSIQGEAQQTEQIKMSENKHSINTSQLANGVYIITIFAGELRHSQKITIQK